MRACARPRMSPEREQPRTQTYMSCEPARSKRMSRFHKSHLIRKFTGKMPCPRMSPEGRRTLCASRRSRTACQNCTRQSKRMSRFHKSHFIRKFTGKMPPRKTAPQTLCEPAQSKRMSRFHCDPKQHSYRVDDFGNRKREDVTSREDKK